MATRTVEQYVKTLYQLHHLAPNSLVQMKTLSEAMQVTPGSATSMVKHLETAGLLRYYPRKGTELTEEGKRLGLRMIRRHRLLETFLERLLGYDWSEVHREAEELEHAVSETFIARIDALLDSPEVDPHGDPIPRADGTVESPSFIPLSEIPHGATFAVARIGSDDGDFLTLMKERGLVPGAEFVLVEKSQTAGTISVRNLETDTISTIGYDVGQKILVTSQGTTP
ncbi:MAG: metal-dependent transcriptional regulator [Spirochaetaceae bacterium]